MVIAASSKLFNK